MVDPFDEDANVRSRLAALGPEALAASCPGVSLHIRSMILRALTARPASADLATLIAMADTDEVVARFLVAVD